MLSYLKKIMRHNNDRVITLVYYYKKLKFYKSFQHRSALLVILFSSLEFFISPCCTPKPTGMSYKIFSLDGGGSWALIEAHILQNIYGIIKSRELLVEFDRVIANSGGSLELTCLRNDMQFREIISDFKNEA